ncbi:MAG: hypothetical protein VW270_05590 [Candidatus Poseidoniales archaeon]
MASKILIKKSSTASAVPGTSDLDIGELAVNTHDKRVFTKHGGAIVELGTTPSSLVTSTANVTTGTIGTLDVTSSASVPTPSSNTHAANKSYVDTQISQLVASAPNTLDTLNELAAALGDDENFSTTVTNSIATKLPLAGGTMTGDIVLSANKITSTATPATDDTLTRKGYVDSILGSATDAATSASNAATSESNAATSATNAASSASNASTSETNAASSASSASTSATSASTSATAAATSATTASTAATNAAASYDSFDDRYLGAKSSDPTLDNDGDALLSGALYFNSTSNDFKVYNGSSWQVTALTTYNPTFTGTVTSDELLIQNSASGSVAVFESTSGLSSSGPDIDLKRSSSSPATNDYLTTLNFVGKDSGGDDTNYASVGSQIFLPNAGGEYGRFFINTMQNGSETTALQATNAVVLNYNGSNRLQTTTDGVSVNGTLTASDAYLGSAWAVTDKDTTLTGSFRGSISTDNDLSFDMNVRNNFKCTPTAGAALTFTNITSGQSGNIFLDNSAGVTITAAATTKINSTDLTTISTAGTYFLSYYSDGTNVLVATSQSVTA